MKRFSLCEIFRYQVHIASYIASGLDRDSLEDMYKEVRSRGLVEGDGGLGWRCRVLTQCAV